MQWACMNSDDFTVLVSGHVYCVATAFRMTEWVEQWICIKFCVKLAHSSMETIRMIQKAFGDNAVSAEQIKVWHGTNASKMVENLLKVIHVLEGRQQIEQLRMLNLYGMQLKICVRSQSAYFLRGLRCHCPMCNVSCIFLNKCLYFTILHGWILSGETSSIELAFILSFLFIFWKLLLDYFTYKSLIFSSHFYPATSGKEK